MIYFLPGKPGGNFGAAPGGKRAVAWFLRCGGTYADAAGLGAAGGAILGSGSGFEIPAHSH